jgi:CubicO group peptidase (beta-lactamase class C family)
MRILIFIVTSLLCSNLVAQDYFPERGNQNWIWKTPAEVGLDAIQIDSAIAYAQSQESANPRNLQIAHYQSFGREPFGDGIGPHKTRGAQTGIIIKDGYIIAEWGEPARVDMTFSVSKSFLSATVGVAYDQGLIADVHDPVSAYMAPIYLDDVPVGDNKAAFFGEPMTLDLFESEHNKKVTWDHLLRQTSDWEGTLWGKPDWADRPDADPTKWLNREKKEPGSAYEYNDTRVNVLALAAMNLWNRPIQDVLKEYVMEPIGASTTWRWMGYHNSWIILNGIKTQVPSGGGHWGGGMFINAYDQARFGYLTLNRGVWDGERILSDEWVTMSLTPTPVKTDYGIMNWFLNYDQVRLPDAPKEAFFHLGAGVNMVYVDPIHDLVIVTRWTEGSAMNGIVKRVLSAIE